MRRALDAAAVPRSALIPAGEEHFFFQAEDGIRAYKVTGVQTCALPIFRLHGDSGLELEGLVLRGGQVVVVLRLIGRPDARRRGGVPEPAADMALDRFGEDAVTAQAREQDLRWHLALAEPGHLGGFGEIGGRVLDRVLDVGTRYLDGQADTIVVKLFDLSLHPGHSSRPASGSVA